MSDIEYRAATLAARYATLWLASTQIFIGLLQCAVVAYGIRAMMRATAERGREAREAADPRHAETMAAIETQSRAREALIERTASRAIQ